MVKLNPLEPLAPESELGLVDYEPTFVLESPRDLLGVFAILDNFCQTHTSYDPPTLPNTVLCLFICFRFQRDVYDNQKSLSVE